MSFVQANKSQGVFKLLVCAFEALINICITRFLTTHIQQLVVLDDDICRHIRFTSSHSQDIVLTTHPELNLYFYTFVSNCFLLAPKLIDRQISSNSKKQHNAKNRDCKSLTFLQLYLTHQIETNCKTIRNSFHQMISCKP